MTTRAAVMRLCALSLTLVTGCAAELRWQAGDAACPEEARRFLVSNSADETMVDPLPSEIPRVPMRQRLRPCCAFGADVGARLGPIPLPGYRIANILDPSEIGRHTYDSGTLHLRTSGQETLLLNNENNGLVYTCRGGFIDIAHVRDYADWSLFIGTSLARSLETGTRIDLPNEGGRRTILLKPVSPTLIELIGRVRIAAALTEWITFQLSVWHEIATWYGWESVPGFSERVSAFSPEDLYSNLLGIKMLTAIAQRRSGRAENVYNASVDAWLKAMLVVLRAVPKDVALGAMRAVDGLWWDSKRRLPDPRLVLRRHLDFESPVQPWLVPRERLDEKTAERLRDLCGDTPDPLPLKYASARGTYQFNDWVTLEIRVTDDLRKRAPFDSMSERLTQDDFPAVLETIRQQVRGEFGSRADRQD